LNLAENNQRQIQSNFLDDTKVFTPVESTEKDKFAFSENENIEKYIALFKKVKKILEERHILKM